MKNRRRALLFLFILAVISISNYGGTISYTFFYAVILVPFISLIYLIYVYLRFAVYQEIKTRNIIAGEPVPYNFILSNQGKSVFTAVSVNLYSDFSSVSDVPDNHEFCLFPGEKIIFDTMMNCKYRGNYEVGVKKLIINDFFGIFRVSYNMPSNISAIVKPRIVRFEDLNETPELEAFVQSHLKQEINEPDLTVREYQHGDSLKRIHWKSTARSAKLKVRNEVGTIKQKILLMADFERISAKMNIYLPSENQTLEQVIGLLYFLVRQNVPAEIYYLNDKAETRYVSDISHFNQLYEELALLNFREKNSFAGLFIEAGKSGLLASATMIFMVIQLLDDDLFTEIAGLTLSGKIIVVYVVTNKDISGYIRHSNSRLKILQVKPK